MGCHGAHTELPRKAQVVFRAGEGQKLEVAGCDPHGDAGVIAAEPSAAQAYGLVAMPGQGGRQCLGAGGAFQIGRTFKPIGEDGAQAALVQGVQAGIGKAFANAAIVEIQHRRDAGIDRLQRAGIGRDVAVFGPEERTAAPEGLDQIARPRAVGDKSAQQRHPQMPMTTDQARHGDHTAGIDGLGIVDAQIGPDGGDAFVLDQDIGSALSTDFRIDRDDAGVPDDTFRAHGVLDIS